MSYARSKNAHTMPTHDEYARFLREYTALFEHGPERIAGEPHIIWRRIGGHDILDEP